GSRTPASPQLSRSPQQRWRRWLSWGSRRLGIEGERAQSKDGGDGVPSVLEVTSTQVGPRLRIKLTLHQKALARARTGAAEKQGVHRLKLSWLTYLQRKEVAMSEDVANETRFPLKTAALRVFDLPLSWYNSLIQVKISPGLKKLFAITAVSAITVLFLAHHFKRKRGKKTRKVSPWESDHLMFDYAKASGSEKNSSCSSSKQNLTLSLNSIKEKGFQSYIHASGDLFNKYSGSLQSLASVRMELFEEALQRWEQALTFRNRKVEDEASCGGIKLGAGDAIAEEHIEDIISAEFIHKLELLLQRAYLQEEFEASLGVSDPASFANEA
ncbi:hypothetical protein E2320_010408, partial [Naja naja]